MKEMTNYDRALKVSKALSTEYDNFPGRTVEEDVIYALTDIRHLCDYAEWDFHLLVRESHRHYIKERKEA